MPTADRYISRLSLFSLIYKLVLNRNEGPRIPILIQAVGVNKLLDLLDF
ncbi:hypothetical protein [Paenibacillus caui]|nr:hypothetical protein [Paenibacillus caui]